MKLKNIFFDLDGTIVESSLGIKNGFRYTFDKLNYPQLDDQVLNTFIGPPLEATFLDLSHGDETWAALATKTYREYYGAKGMFEATVYDGVLETLSDLRASSHKLYIATSKNEAVALKMLDAMSLTTAFDGIFGSTPLAHSKTLVLDKALTLTSSERKHSVMIGDRDYDIIGGLENSVARTIGVLWGFGDKNELEKAGASDIVAKPQEILGVIK
ncbi:HAD hydrolase-like protein [Lactococcus insecticola]|uniref:Phosphoglycolate phosphatase n=1 Tax=Pseudolactococcus insecticola TaxID=2709158 RepID=A0A6A0B2Z8_9LACT|nr:HAD hydrolase-like protein [Lactococcus insecticola]GFH39699.1 phosphoglycolate phosphatase [Lactococcus insecticola]